MAVESSEYLRGKMSQCRRLAKATLDARTLADLSALADEFEAKAKEVEARTRSARMLADGSSGYLAPDV